VEEERRKDSKGENLRLRKKRNRLEKQNFARDLDNAEPVESNMSARN